mmetsp:Transcript_24989/g.59364  ORF Transcript_24989/g.59364 Transcript_24989/m.59364 type:complete len:135 (-) Transcript_24989:228-632(-)
MAGMRGHVGCALLLLTALSLVALSSADDSHPKGKVFTATTVGKLAEMKAHTQSMANSSKTDDDSKEGPSFVQIWEIREYFARMFGLALICGIVLIIFVCCFTQPGCMVYDKFFDKGPQVQLDDDEEQAMMGQKT